MKHDSIVQFLTISKVNELKNFIVKKIEKKVNKFKLMKINEN